MLQMDGSPHNWFEGRFDKQYDFSKDMYATISTFGNIQFDDQNSFSIRQSCLIKYTKHNDNGT
jgi:hypothetical protein